MPNNSRIFQLKTESYKLLLTHKTQDQSPRMYNNINTAVEESYRISSPNKAYRVTNTMVIVTGVLSVNFSIFFYDPKNNWYS